MNMMPTVSPGRRRGRSATSRRPTFLYIGTPKAGSTWIYNALREHPDVFIPLARNISFFDQKYDRGWDWYLRFFNGSGRSLAIGDISHNYYLSKEAAQRIRYHLPDARLVCCLREPGDFAISMLQWWRNHTMQYGRTFTEIAANPRFLKLVEYKENLENYFRLFSRDQILIAYFEEMKANSRDFLRKLYEFVGVDASYEPATLIGRSNPTREPRNRRLLIFICAAAQLIRSLGGDRVVDAIRWRPGFDKSLYKLFYSAKQQMKDLSEAAELEYLAESIRLKVSCEFEALAMLIGKPLPAEWLRAPSD